MTYPTERLAQPSADQIAANVIGVWSTRPMNEADNHLWTLLATEVERFGWRIARPIAWDVVSECEARRYPALAAWLVTNAEPVVA
jgi:hypothetical protein